MTFDDEPPCKEYPFPDCRDFDGNRCPFWSLVRGYMVCGAVGDPS